MTAANEQIIQAFEELGLTPEQIAEQFEYDLTSVKAILAQFSAQFRREAKVNDEFNFSDEELVQANQVIKQIAQYAEDDHLRFRAACYIRDDKKGRLDAVKQMAGLNVNVLTFNMQMQKAVDAIRRVKSNPVVDLIPEKV